jgi:hypothetical protein
MIVWAGLSVNMTLLSALACSRLFRFRVLANHEFGIGDSWQSPWSVRDQDLRFKDLSFFERTGATAYRPAVTP